MVAQQGDAEMKHAGFFRIILGGEQGGGGVEKDGCGPGGEGGQQFFSPFLHRPGRRRVQKPDGVGAQEDDAGGLDQACGECGRQRRFFAPVEEKRQAQHDSERERGLLPLCGHAPAQDRFGKGGDSPEKRESGRTELPHQPQEQHPGCGQRREVDQMPGDMDRDRRQEGIERSVDERHDAERVDAGAAVAELFLRPVKLRQVEVAPRQIDRLIVEPENFIPVRRIGQRGDVQKREEKKEQREKLRPRLEQLRQLPFDAPCRHIPPFPSVMKDFGIYHFKFGKSRDGGSFRIVQSDGFPCQNTRFFASSAPWS